MEMKIYLANLGKYNEGELVGKWFDLPVDMEEALVIIGCAHYNEDGEFVPWVEENGVIYEEWAIHDYELPFHVHEYEDIDDLNEVVAVLDGVDEDIIEAAMEYAGDDFNCAAEKIRAGEYVVFEDCHSMRDVAYDWIQETGMLDNVDETIKGYFDYEAYGRDLEIEGFFYAGNGRMIEIIG